MKQLIERKQYNDLKFPNLAKMENLRNYVMEVSDYYVFTLFKSPNFQFLRSLAICATESIVFEWVSSIFNYAEFGTIKSGKTKTTNKIRETPIKLLAVNL